MIGCYFGHDPVLLFIMLTLNMISLTVGGHFGSEGLGANPLTNFSVPKTPGTNYILGRPRECLKSLEIMGFKNAVMVVSYYITQIFNGFSIK